MKKIIENILDKYGFNRQNEKTFVKTIEPKDDSKLELIIYIEQYNESNETKFKVYCRGVHLSFESSSLLIALMNAMIKTRDESILSNVKNKYVKERENVHVKRHSEYYRVLEKIIFSLLYELEK